MVPVAHVIMHVAFCASIARAPETASVPLRVTLVNRTEKPNYDRTFTVTRGTADRATIEFDAPQGVYRLLVGSPKYNCASVDYVYFIADHLRNMDEKLHDGPAPLVEPTLMVGSAPPPFLYLKPQVVLFDRTTTCNKPVVGDPIQVAAQTEYDQDGYYSWLNATRDLIARAPLVAAFQIATPTGEFHYIRLKLPFPLPWRGWPQVYQFNVGDNLIDWVSGQPTDTLLCPKIYETSAG